MEVGRPVTPHEAAVLRWLLQNAATRHAPGYQTYPVEQLRVIDGCKCGCTSLDFAPGAWGGGTIIADAIALYPDRQQAGLILWARDGEITSLEVYDCHPGASHRFPEIADLRRWEDLAS